MLMFMMLYRVCTHVRPVILAMILCVYVGDVVEGIYTCKTLNFGKSVHVYVCILVEGMYTFKNCHSVNNTLCFCFCWCRGYVNM